MSNNEFDQRTAVELAATIAEPFIVSDVRDRPAALLHVLPEGYKVNVIDVTRYHETPARKTGTVTVTDVPSFLRYVNLHGQALATTLYAARDSSRIMAVLNDHANGQAGWADHAVTLTLTRTPEWQRWLGANGQWMGQEEFAEFVEESVPEFRTPVASHMLELARSLTATTNSEFESGVRLDNGDRELIYKTTTTAKAGTKGTLEVPTNLVLGIRVYRGGQGYNVDARFRYKITNGVLYLSYKIDRLTDVIETAFDDATEQIAADLTVPEVLIVHGARG